MYRLIGWIVLYLLDLIVLDEYYCIIWIVSGDTRYYALTDLLLAVWYRWTEWDVGGTGVVWTDVSRRQKGSANIGAITGAPSLDLEGRRLVGSGGWHQLSW